MVKMPRTFLVRRAGEEKDSLCHDTEVEQDSEESNKENVSSDICTGKSIYTCVYGESAKWKG